MMTFDSHFANEATEHLDQLDLLLRQPDVPDAARMLDLALGFRLSAERAGAKTVAEVAERLEDAARSILSQNIAWSEGIRDLSRQTVGDLKLLLRAVNRWGPEEERRVRVALDRWDEHEDVSALGESALPISSFFYDDAGPHIFPATSQDGPESPALGQEDSADQGAKSGRLSDPDFSPDEERARPIERMGNRFEPIEAAGLVDDFEGRTGSGPIDPPGDSMEEADEPQRPPDQPLGGASGDAPAGGWPLDDPEIEPESGASGIPSISDFAPDEPPSPAPASGADDRDPLRRRLDEARGWAASSPSPSSGRDLREDQPGGMVSRGEESERADLAESDELPLIRSFDAKREKGEASTEDNRDIRLDRHPQRLSHRAVNSLSPSDALEEALALRQLFERHGRGDAIPERPLADLVDELFALLEAARGSSRSE